MCKVELYIYIQTNGGHILGMYSKVVIIELNAIRPCNNVQKFMQSVLAKFERLSQFLRIIIKLYIGMSHLLAQFQILFSSLIHFRFYLGCPTQLQLGQ